MFTMYPPFWPALQHNLVWLLTFLFIATPIGIFFAVLLDKNIRGTRIYQSAIYLPVVLSLAIVGFIWQLQYAPEQGFINNILGHNHEGAFISWLGDRNINLAAVLVAASWRHIGYIMVLYLAGLKSVDPSLREAAAIDGASERQTFFRVVLPVLRPINVVILVITIIESLRAFDIVYVINKGQNGLELLSVLITQNIVGESSRVGFGSAIAVVLLVDLGRPDHRVPDPHLRGAGMTAVAEERAVPAEVVASGRARADPAGPGRPPRVPDLSSRCSGCSRCCGPSTRRSARTARPPRTATSRSPRP